MSIQGNAEMKYAQYFSIKRRFVVQDGQCTTLIPQKIPHLFDVWPPDYTTIVSKYGLARFSLLVAVEIIPTCE